LLVRTLVKTGSRLISSIKSAKEIKHLARSPFSSNCHGKYRVSSPTDSHADRALGLFASGPIKATQLRDHTFYPVTAVTLVTTFVRREDILVFSVTARFRTCHHSMSTGDTFALCFLLGGSLILSDAALSSMSISWSRSVSRGSGGG
jgi:hypothetical protein